MAVKPLVLQHQVVRRGCSRNSNRAWKLELQLIRSWSNGSLLKSFRLDQSHKQQVLEATAAATAAASAGAVTATNTTIAAVAATVPLPRLQVQVDLLMKNRPRLGAPGDLGSVAFLLICSPKPQKYQMPWNSVRVGKTQHSKEITRTWNQSISPETAKASHTDSVVCTWPHMATN